MGAPGRRGAAAEQQPRPPSGAWSAAAPPRKRGGAPQRNEPLASLHPAAGRHRAADGWPSCSPGLVGRLLPLSALPQVDYPTIQVQTLYPGASPEVMAQTVTAPLERQFGQMPGLRA